MSIFLATVHRRFSDLDPLGHVNNVAYVDYLQEARVQILQSVGKMELMGFSQVIVRQEMQYLKPLQFHPDPISIEVTVPHIGGASYTFDYRVIDESGQVAATATTVQAQIDTATGKARRLDADLREILHRYATP